MAYIVNRGENAPETDGIAPEIANQFATLQEMAKSTLRKRKPIYDFKTTNKSFLNLYSDLRRLGVKNNKFFLKLYDKDLAGLDVYAIQKPPIDLQLKIHLECMINPWYYLRELCRIPEPGLPIEPGGGIRYKIDRNNAACWYLFLNGIDTYQSKPRQQGKTQDCVAKFNYAFLYGTASSNILFFNKDADGAIGNLTRLKDQRSLLPDWMQMRTLTLDDGKTVKGTNNVKTVQNPLNGNRITAMGSATNKESAMKLGRGATAPLQYFDEFDFFPYNVEVMNASVFAYSKAAEVAQRNRALYGRCLSSTPGDLSTRDGTAATEYIDHMLKWDDTTFNGNTTSFFDVDINVIKKTIHSTNYIPIVYVEHSWQQLKLPMAWYEKQCNSVGYAEDVILREINLKRINGSSLSPFKRSSVIYITNHQKEPIEKIDYSKNMSPFCIYEKLYRNYPYILSVDPSEGLGGDNNACTLINPYTLKPAMEFQSKYISQPDFQKILERFMDEHCPRSMIVIEANKGRELINCFLASKYRYQVYYDDNKLAKSKVESVDEYGTARRAAMERRAYGFDTTRGTRPELYAIIENFMEERLDMIFTKYLVDDVAGLIRKTTRIEAGKGKHDDNIMSYLIGLFVYYNAPSELLEVFGIRRGMIEPSKQVEKADTPEEQRARLQDMYSAMPPEMQELIKDTLFEKDPMEETWDYYREVERIKQSNIQDGRPDPYSPQGTHTVSGALMDEAFWNQYDQQILASNDYDTDRYNVDVDRLFGSDF